MGNDDSDEQIRDEAARVRRLFSNQDPQLVGYLAGQLTTLKTYAQVLVGLCGLTVTVTGFSGAHMIRAGSLSAALMVTGIALVLVGLVLCLRTLTVLRWVSQDLRDDLLETTLIIIRRRNRQQRQVGVAAVFVASGLVFYLAAVSAAAFMASSFEPR
jgi:hypothetical protein